jgi:hypothetical protein
LDAKTLEDGMHLTFETPYGSLDPSGAPSYDRLVVAGEPAEEVVTICVTSLDHLIAMKEAPGRTKDKLMATEYRVIADELRAPRDG